MCGEMKMSACQVVVPSLSTTKLAIRAISLAVSGLLLSGCAAALSAYKNRSSNKMDIGATSAQAGEIVIVTGERRIAIAIPNQANFQFCAEALPDAAAAFGAASSAGLARPGMQGGINESSAMGLLQTFNRTENAELLRSWGFISCLAKAQRHFEDPEYRALFTTMTNGLVEVMKANAANTTAILATGGTVTVNPSPQAVTTQIPSRRTPAIPPGSSTPQSTPDDQPRDSGQPSGG